MQRPTPLFRGYAALTGLLAPLAYRKVAAKLRRHAVPPARIAERLGHATHARPTGQLVWFHAASVGESLSILALITALQKRNTALHFLITTGTATSAEILARRMPANCQHQFAPLDSRAVLRRFLDHWQPDLAVFVESELWPLMLAETRARGVPLMLINARLSAGSIRKWQRIPKTAGFLLGLFARITAQTPATLNALLNLGANPATTGLGADLKAAAGALPYDADQLETIRHQIAQRPLWVASSTHAGEEEALLDAHAKLLKSNPDLLLVLVPRHPDRAREITALAAARHLSLKTRSLNQPVTPDTRVYLADTLGETGLWYALAPIVFLGGSLVPVGGHNPYEPAHQGAAILHGPHVTNFAPTYQLLRSAQASVEIQDATTLANAVATLLQTPSQRIALGQAARAFATTQSGGLEQVVTDLFALLENV